MLMMEGNRPELEQMHGGTASFRVGVVRWSRPCSSFEVALTLLDRGSGLH